MREWEDIVREKLEGYEKPLPEGALARFHARRNQATNTPAPKRFSILWAPAVAVTAGIVALIFLRRPDTPEDGIRIFPQPVTLIAAVSDSTDATESPWETTIHAQAGKSNADKLSCVSTQEVINDQDAEASVEAVSIISGDDDQSPEKDEAVSQNRQAERVKNEPVIPISSPFVPESLVTKRVNLDVVPATIGIVGSGSLVAFVTAVAPLLVTRDYQFEEWPNGEMMMKRPVHYMPLKAGMSVRFPISERLSISSGFDYSLYFSQFSYKIAGNKNQALHYLGMPLRLDGTLASNKWLDVYVGGGLKGDYCVAALQNGEAIDKDKFAISIVGVGGIQYNITGQLGIYIEPEISYTVAKINLTPTYRTTNPIMFSINSGIRLTFSK